ncbi:MAG: hypothetical protein JXB04_09820 [Kiritimatiellae bacterium]|nr:hypothetical protein [Kiritimatiellia bacterium]
MLPMLCGGDRLASWGWVTNFHIPFLLLPSWVAHGLVTFVQRFVAGYFTYRLCRDVLELKKPIAFAAGFAYPLTHTDLGEMCYMHLLNEPGLPCLLWFFGRLPLARLGRALLLSALFAVLLGWSMTLVTGLFFLVPAAFLFAEFLRGDARTTRAQAVLLLSLAGFTVIAVAKDVPDTWAMLLNAGDSHRNVWDVAVHSPDWGKFLRERFVFFGRWWLALPLLGTWMVSRRFRGRADRAVLALLLLGTVIGPLLQPLRAWFGAFIGPLRGFDFGRFEMVGPLAMMCGAALGLNVVSRWTFTLVGPGGGRPRAFPASSMASVVVVLLAMFESAGLKAVHWDLMRNSGYNWQALYRNPVVGNVAASRSDDRLVRWATAAAYHEYSPGFLAAYGLETADGYMSLYPRRYHQFWNAVIRPLRDLDPEVRGFHLWGTRVYLHHARSIDKLFVPEIPFADWYNLNLLSLANVGYVVSRKPLRDARLVQREAGLQDAMRAEWSGLRTSEKIRRFLRGESPPGIRAYVYENPGVLERYRFVRDARLLGGDKELLRVLSDATLDELRSTVFFAAGDVRGKDVSLGSPATAGSVSLLSYSLEHAELETESDGEGYLVASVLFYPWWSCTVDGREVCILPAYGTFQAVKLGPGRHRVVFDYQPPYAAAVPGLRQGSR